MEIKVEPIRNRVWIKKDDPVEKTSGGLYIPEVSQEKPIFGTVIATGPGRVTSEGAFLENQVKPGDRVLFPKYAGVNAQIDGQKLFIISDHEILAVVD